MQPPAQQQPAQPPAPQQPHHAGDGIAPGPHRIHPAHLVLNALRVMAAIVAFAFFSFLRLIPELMGNEINSELRTLILGGAAALLLLIFALVVAVSFISYRRFSWEITATDIHIRSGIVFKKQVHIPFARVQSIDFNAGVFERVLGLVKLKVETAGGAANRGVVIPALKLAQAEALRAEVFARRQSSTQQQEAEFRHKAAALRRPAAQTEAEQAAAAPRPDSQTEQPLAPPRPDSQIEQPLTVSVPTAQTPTAADNFVRAVGDEMAGLRGIFADNYQENAPVEYEYGLTARELFFSAVSNDGNLLLFFVLAGGMAANWAVFFGVGELAGQVSDDLLGLVTGGVAIALVVVFVFSLLMGVLSSAITYGGFKTRRRGGRIEVEHGLITRQYRGVSIARVQAVEIRQGFIRRLFGYAALKLLIVDSVSAENNQQGKQSQQVGRLIIHPFVKMSKVAGILERLVPEFDARPAVSELRALPRAALRRSIVRSGVIPALLYAAVISGITIFLNLASFVPARVAQPVIVVLWSLAALLTLLQFIGGILWYRHAGFAYNPTMLLIRQGGYSQVTTVVPRRKMQWGATRQNPLQRIADLATVSVVTAAGVGGTSLSLRDWKLADAYAFLDWLRPRPRDAASR
jgi:putative membrane protein